jgi:hypothetical protein
MRRMRFCVLLFSVCALASGQQLRVKSATAKSVQLEWSGATGTVTIERNMQKIGTSDQPAYEDTAIDRFATYRYRVTAGGKSSNEVVVGPPPAGVLNVSAAPKNRDAGHYGQATAIALDDNGDPAVAFEWLDPNNDGDYSDNEIRFVGWDRAAYKWLASTRVQVVGDIGNQNLNPISIACDAATGLLLIVTPMPDKGASVLTSKDRGTTWTAAPLPGVAGTVYSTAMAIGGGKVHLVVSSSDSGAQYLTGPAADMSGWKSTPLPVSSGWKLPAGVNVALTLDGAGKPALAWYEIPEEGDGRHFQFWRPEGKPVTAIDTKRTTDSPNLALTAGGGKFGLLIQTPLDEKDEDHGIWYTQSADGAAWSKPSKLPVDGPRTTNPPLDVALDSHGRIVAVFGSNGGSAGTGCNYPALSRSSDGTQWKTCGPGKAEGGDFGAQPSTLHAIEAGNDKVYVLWQEPGENKYKQGVLLWHER